LLIFFTVFDSSAKKTEAKHIIKYNTTTVYEDRTFKTTSSFTVNAPYSVANQVMEKFIHDLDSDPYSLFDNVLKGMGDTDENGNDNNQSTSRFSADIKSCVYDSAHDYYIGKIDLIIGKSTIKDITLYGRIHKSYHNNYAVFTFELLNNPIAKKAKGIIVTKKISENSTKLELNANFQFAWFLNLFFSVKNYKDVAEWRLDKFMQNLNEEIVKKNAK